VNASDLLLEKAKEYELQVAHHDERAPVDRASRGSAPLFAAIAIVLREVAEALEHEREAT